jgi:hypothetical protein
MRRYKRLKTYSIKGSMNGCDGYLLGMKKRIRIETCNIAPSYVQTHLAVRSDA